jgi:membrane protease YdiL (CAAX protease family)
MSDLASFPAASPELSAPVPDQRNAVFFGPNGLRAGWGLLLFALMAACIFIGGHIFAQATDIAQHHAPASASFVNSPIVQIAESLFYLIAVVVSAILLSSRKVFGSGKAALTGVLLAVALAVLVSTIVHVNHVQKAKIAASGKPAPQAQTPAATPAASSTQQELRAAGSEAVVFAIVLLITWIMSRIENRKFGEYGLGGNSRRWPQLLQGLIVGFCALSLLVLALDLGHWIVFNGPLLHSPASIVENGVLWLLAFTFVGFFEEFFFRGYMQFTLARGIGFGAIGFYIAALLLNFGFGFGHGSNPGESPIGLWTAGLIGFVFCISLWYTRSLWWAIGFHATWDWGESYFYGTADSGGVSQGRLLDSHPQGKLLMSGGPTGPEGSVLCLGVIVLIALFVWIALRHERNKSTNQALINPVAGPVT